MEHNPQLSVSRRDLLIAGASTAAATAVPRSAGAQVQPPSIPEGVQLPVTLQVNGQEHRLDLDTRTTLLDALREHLHLTGTKKGCDHGQCGACTVLRDGKRINACLTLAIMCDGADLVTIEGLASGDQLHPMQRAFITHDAFQCGYCTPGQICSAVGLAREGHAATPDVIREQMSGNLCRCGAYSNIVAAVQEALPLMRAAPQAQGDQQP